MDHAPNIRAAAAVLAAGVVLLGASARAQTQEAESLVPLGAAQVSELHGDAWVVYPLQPPPSTLATAPPAAPGGGRPATAVERQALHPGDRLRPDGRVSTASAADSRIELTFPDGSLVRAAADTTLTLLNAKRALALHRGQVLVQADRMVGGVQVLLPTVAMVPEGTTYLVAVADQHPDEVRLTVFEGAVCACEVTIAARPPLATASPRGAPPPPPAANKSPRPLIVLPGETLELKGSPQNALLHPKPYPLLLGLRTESLLATFTRPLASMWRIEDLIDQQQRNVLAGRNERLRREIFWKRPPRPPIALPDLFTEPSYHIMRY